MEYLLKHFDTPLLRFSAEDGVDNHIAIIWINDEMKSLLPLDLPEVSAKGIEAWVRQRSIPKNRAYVDSLLSTMGLSSNRPFDVMKVSKGLSLNDCYWIVEAGFDGTFDDYNLYDNRFSRVLGEIAFTGYGSDQVTGILSSPELTTNGMLPKCWRRESGVIRLYKGGTEGASNTGNEPYSEYFAAQIAEALGINAIGYSLAKWKGKLCSTCELFTSKELSFVPIGKIVRSGGMPAVRAYCKTLGEAFTEALDDMILFDAVIFNTDRHFGNFGFLVDSRSNSIVAPAPLFDHGNSLFSLAGRDALKSEEALWKYAGTLRPCMYDDFVGEAKSVMTLRQREMLRGMLDFRLKRHRRYSLPVDRIRLIESTVAKRVKELLK